MALTDSAGAVVTQYNYSPEMRRFISEDPIRKSIGLLATLGAGDVNFYAYVGNNPVNFVDPLGLEPPPVSRSQEETFEYLILGNHSSIFEFSAGNNLDMASKLGSKYYNYGNYIFGLVAASKGIQKYIAHQGAGVVEVLNHGIGEGVIIFKAPYFDKSIDYKWIEEGYKDYEAIYKAQLDEFNKLLNDCDWGNGK